MRALVIENDPVSAGLIDAALKSEGIISEPAETGEDALDLAKHYSFGVMILGSRLPDMKASVVVRRLRSAKVPLLILLDADEIDEDLRGLAMPTTI
jgi:two-component system, cell cycle response regulator CtrA